MLDKNGIQSNVTCLVEFRRAANARRNGLLLIEATTINDLVAIAALIAKGADVNVQDGFGRTSLHRAALNGSQDACGLIIGSGKCNPTIHDHFDKYASDLVNWRENYKLWRKLINFEVKQAKKMGVKLLVDENIKLDFD